MTLSACSALLKEGIPFRTEIDKVVIMHVPSVCAFFLDHVAQMSSIYLLHRRAHHSNIAKHMPCMIVYLSQYSTLTFKIS